MQSGPNSGGLWTTKPAPQQGTRFLRGLPYDLQDATAAVGLDLAALRVVSCQAAPLTCRPFDAADPASAAASCSATNALGGIFFGILY